MPNTVTIQSGQTLSEIAVKYGVSVEDLKKANGITNADDIKAGQKINIPIASNKPQGVGDNVDNKPKAPNATIAKYSYSKEEVAENTQYSNEKIKKTYETNAKEKKATATLSADPYSGHVMIQPKRKVTAEELKKMYNIPDGVLKNYNPIDYSWGTLPDDHHYKDYGNPTFNKGDKVIVPASSFEYGGFLKEAWHEIKSWF
ncbi:MAG: LysM peptidoglycan-binding domain-containing protein [Clostridium sp.]|nr:LysM peptidoglycan-binding domain-containing protein [Clostridium sp.]